VLKYESSCNGVEHDHGGEADVGEEELERLHAAVAVGCPTLSLLLLEPQSLVLGHHRVVGHVHGRGTRGAAGVLRRQ